MGVVQVKAPDQVPLNIREEILEEVGYRCEVCPARGEKAGGEATLHLHHRESPARGGTHDRENVLVMCSDCHHHHHSSRVGPEEIQTSLDTVELDPTPADFKLLQAIERVAPTTAGVLADEASISDVHARRRLYALAASGIVSMTTDKEWDLTEYVDDPVKGKLPDDPEQAARHARDDVIRRMHDRGDLGYAEIADIVGLSERTIPTAINRARAFDPPVPPANEVSKPDLSDLARRVSSIERQLDANT